MRTLKPLAKSQRIDEGMISATRKASVVPVAPKYLATRTSRKKPKNLLIKEKTAITTAA